MKYIFTRIGKDGKCHDCQCSLFIDSGKNFTVYFDTVTPEIGLNDGYYHSITDLRGIITTVTISNEGISLEGCFVNINCCWHRDGFLFKFK